MIIYATEERWLAWRGDEAIELAPYPALDEAAVVVWNPAREVAGVASFQGNPRHAAALVERKLRQAGEIENDTRIVIHRVEPFQDTYSAFYGAVPMDDWQRLLAWVARQRVSCIAYSALALLSQATGRFGATILHDGTRMAFFSRVGPQLRYAGVIAFSAAAEDLELAARSLGERARLALAPLRDGPGTDALRATWCSAAGRADDDGALARAFADAAGIDCTVADQVYGVAGTGEPIASSIPSLARAMTPRACLNPPGDRFLYLLERLLAPAALAACVVSLPLDALGLYWLVHAQALEAQSAGIRAAAAQESRDAGAVTPNPVLQAQLDKQLGFVQTATHLARDVDLPAVLRTLRDASGDAIRILGARTEEPHAAAKGAEGPPAVLVDGALAKDRAAWDDQLAGFVRALKAAGYAVEPVDSRSGASVGSMSGTLFSYRITPAAPAREARP